MSDLLDDDRYWTLGTLSQRYVKDVQAYIFRLEAARDLLKSRVAELEDDVAELGESRKDAVAEIEQLIEDRTATRERVEAAAVERDQLRARVAELEGWRPIETAPQSSYGNKPTLLGYKRFAQRYIVVGSQEHLAANGATHWMPLPTPPSCAKVHRRGRTPIRKGGAYADPR